MTEDLFFDTDCLSAFLWINNTNILHELYGGKIVLPEPVYQELMMYRGNSLHKETAKLSTWQEYLAKEVENMAVYHEYVKIEERIYLNVPYMGRGFAKACYCGFDTKKKLWFTERKNRFLKQLIEMYGINENTDSDIKMEILKAMENE